MVRHRRGFSLIEWSVAVCLALVLIPALFPAPRAEVGLLRGTYEAEAARLLLEGELVRARRDAAAGRLTPARAAALPSDDFPSARHLEGLALQRHVRARGEGLLEVRVQATWRSRAADARGATRDAELSTLVVLGRTP